MAIWQFKHRFYFPAFLFFCFFMNIYPAYADTEVITLQHRMPEELVPILSPFLNKDGVIKAFENQLIIQTGPDNLAALKKMVNDLDKAPKKLLLSVSQSKDAPSESFSVDINGKVVFGEDQMQSSAQISSSIGTSREEHQSLNRIQVISGTPAMITSGKTVALVASRGAYQDQGRYSRNQLNQENSQNYSLPTDNADTVIKNTNGSSTNQNSLTITNNPTDPNLPSSDVVLSPVPGGNATLSTTNKSKISASQGDYNADAFQEQYLYDQLQSGAIVTPTLIGNRVRLDILLQNEVPVKQADNNLKTNSVTKAMQRTKTVMEVPLGEWVYVGGNQASQIENSISTRSRTKSRDESKMSIWVRVDKIGD